MKAKTIDLLADSANKFVHFKSQEFLASSMIWSSVESGREHLVKFARQNLTLMIFFGINLQLILWLLELDDRSDATESTDCGVHLPYPEDNLGINPVDVHVMSDIGGNGVNGLGVRVNGTSNPKDCNKSFDLLSRALLRWQFTWLKLVTFNHNSSVQQWPYKSWLELRQTEHDIIFCLYASEKQCHNLLWRLQVRRHCHLIYWIQNECKHWKLALPLQNCISWKVHVL